MHGVHAWAHAAAAPDAGLVQFWNATAWAGRMACMLLWWPVAPCGARSRVTSVCAWDLHPPFRRPLCRLPPPGPNLLAAGVRRVCSMLSLWIVECPQMNGEWHQGPLDVARRSRRRAPHPPHIHRHPCHPTPPGPRRQPGRGAMQEEASASAAPSPRAPPAGPRRAACRP